MYDLHRVSYNSCRIRYESWISCSISRNALKTHEIYHITHLIPPLYNLCSRTDTPTQTPSLAPGDPQNTIQYAVKTGCRNHQHQDSNTRTRVAEREIVNEIPHLVRSQQYPYYSRYTKASGTEIKLWDDKVAYSSAHLLHRPHRSISLIYAFTPGIGAMDCDLRTCGRYPEYGCRT